MSKRREFLIRLLLIIVIICCLTHTSLGQENDTVSLGKSISILNTVASLIGVLVALLTLIIVIGGTFGFLEYRRWKEIREQAEENAEKMQKAAEEAEPIIERLKKAEKDAENKLNTFRELTKDLPSPSETFSEDQKKILDEYGKKTEIFEAFGVPLKFEDYLNRGTDFYQKGEYELALKGYDKAIELKPDDANARNNRGVALDELGRYDEALKAFDKAIELQSDYANAWNNRGVVLGSKSKPRRYDEALEAYKKASELEPDFAEAWFNQACIYSLKGDKKNALKHLSKAIDLDAKYKEKAKTDDDFKNLWDDEDFKRIVS
jgi:tetratricopeptide (TPR) repeat protein